MFDTTVKQVVEVALDGLAARQRVIADNVANIQTPSFLAGRVQFEQALTSALTDGTSPSTVRPTVARSLEPTRTDGNNVNLDHEMIGNMDTGLRYQLMLYAIEKKTAGLLSTVKSIT